MVSVIFRGLEKPLERIDMESTLVIRGRRITFTDIGIIHALVDRYHDRSRHVISRKLAETWQWYQPNGRLKTRACHDILSKLESRGLISLPPLRIHHSPLRTWRPIPDPMIPVDMSLIRGTVKEFKPFRCHVVSGTSLEPLWNYLVSRYHYLGYRVLVGAHLKYLVHSGSRVVAALGWSSAVWHLEARDRAIGWSTVQKQRHLHRIANNTRFLMLPWVEIPYAASHILSRNIRTLNHDWFERYHYRLWLLETFVDPDRFKGTCYRAANWIHAGHTKGFRKEGNTFHFHGHRKEVFVYPLHPDFRTRIGCDSPLLQPLDHRYRTFEPLRGGTHMIVRHEGWNPDVPPPFELDEEDIDAIVDEFEQFHGRFEPAFHRIEQVELSQCYLQGLMSPLQRKSMEPIALSLMSTHRVRSLQHFVSAGKWSLDQLAQIHKKEAALIVAHPQGVINVDGSDFQKKGKESVGVSRQYCGRLGKVDNCQAGVFLGYSSPNGYILLDRCLYLPEVWFTGKYRERWERCKIPDDTEFKTKPELASRMIEDIRSSGIFPAQWVTCDATFGNNPAFLDKLPDDLYYLADMPANTRVWLTRPHTGIPPYRGKGKRPTRVRLKEGEPASMRVDILSKDPFIQWHTVILSEGEKGPISGKIARKRVIVSRNGLPGNECWLFIRKCEQTKEIKYFLSNVPEDVPLKEMSRVCVLRWPIEQCFKEGKNELGMDQYEHRSWDAWHRHMTFVFIAQLFLLRLRHKFKKNSGAHTTPNKKISSNSIADATI